MSDAAVWPVHTIERGGLRIEVRAQPAVNLALVHNRVPVITELVVTNTSDTPVVGLTVSVRLLGGDGEAGADWSRSVADDLPPGQAASWSDLGDVVPTVEHLKRLNESYPSSILVTVAQRWKDDIVHRIPIEVLAHNEWFNAPIFYDSLAAFVQPNTQAVGKVLDRAAELLRTQTGSASLDAYQQGPERAAIIAAAVYEALRSQQIRYISPPASFENSGQKVRTTAQVLDERFGTCIDLAVTYAACIEQAGLHALIWLVEGHAFSGFMRNEESLKHISATEQNLMVNLFESHRAVALEAMYYEQGPEGSFRAAVEKARRHFAQPASLRALIDISTARRAGVRPIPSEFEVTTSAEPVAADTTSTPGLDLPPELKTHATDDAVLDTADTAPARVKKWKRALLDLSTNNRLLNLKPSAQVIDLVVPARGLAILDDLVHAGKRISLASHDDLSAIYYLQGARTAQELDDGTLLEMLSNDKTAFVAVNDDAYARRLKRLQRDARMLLEETGASNLYLTFGSLVHTTATGAQARAPLFLLPVQLVGGTGKSSFQLIIDSMSVATPNYCLVEWLRLKHNVNLPALTTPPLDDSGVDIVAAFMAIRSGLIEHNVDFRIDETAVLAVCQFGTFGLWKDLNDSWDALAQSPLVQHLTFRPGETYRDDSGDETDLETVAVDETTEPPASHADGSQLRAVELSAAGRTFVLEGPPGTGKSQTITNLIARNLAAGRTVLFVAEKQAALDVVKRRLDAIGLNRFTLNLHGRNQNVAEIRNQLRESIEFRAAYNQHVWDARVADYRSKHQPLADYPGRVHATNTLGDSLWSAYDTVLALGGKSESTIGESYVATATPEESSTIRDAIRLFSRSVQAGDCKPNNPWTIVGQISSADDAIRSAARGLETAFTRLGDDPEALDVLTSLPAPQDVRPLLDRARRERSAASLSPQEWQRLTSPDWQRSKDALVAQAAALRTTWSLLTSSFNPAFLAHGDYAALIQEASEASHGLFGRKKREEQLARSLGAVVLPGVSLTAESAIPLLNSVPSARDHSAHLDAQMREVFGGLAPQVWDPLSANAVADLQPALAYLDESAAYAAAHPVQWKILRSGQPIGQSVLDVLTIVHDAWTRWIGLLGATSETIERWQVGETWLGAWARDHEAWAGEIAQHGVALPRRVARAHEALAPLRRPGLEAFAAQLLDGTLPAGDAEVRYLTEVANASLNERIRTQQFGGFDARVRTGQTSDFAEVTGQLAREQRSALPGRILQRRPFQAGDLKGKAGELRRQLDLKRKGKSVRRLIEDYGDEIQAATPCFFVSPGSLAQFVPPGAVTFDLVVFDEASQITVAQAIGALGRGRSAVIVGDSQQMPPTAFGQVTTNRDDDDDDGDDDVAVEDLDSILTECVESSVPRIWLSWHYRSQDESLIAFSNEKYYKGKLASLPAPGGTTDTGLQLRRVNGHFNREDRKNGLRTNRVEAEAIVAEITSIVRSGAGKSIGVVTFNRQQQELILDLLEETGDQQIAYLLRPDTDDGIFVKNLENVQGDERDIILFSTAFSKRPGERNMPLNFGPLTRAGGEKRLNVAVTRARAKVIVFCSFDPVDIDLSRTRSVGMTHLKAYLESAARASGDQSVTIAGHEHGAPGKVQKSIADALRGRGLEVQLDYGLSDFVVDIAVREPGSPGWQVAIMLDGPGWARRDTVADRELTPGLLVSSMGWGSCVRIWLPEWINNEGPVIDRVMAAVDEARRVQTERDEAKRAAAAAPSPEQPAETPTDLDDTSSESRGLPAAVPEEPDLPAAVPEEPDLPATVQEQAEESVQSQPAGHVADAAAEPFRPVAHVASSPTAEWTADGPAAGAMYIEAPGTALGSRDDLDHANSPDIRERLQDAVREGIEIEGPIALNRLVRNIVRRFGFEKATAKRQDVVRILVPEDLIHRSELGEFVWPHNLDRAHWSGFRRTPAGLSRPLDEIAGEEIVNALAYAARDGVPNHEQLMRDTLALFDQKRLTTQSAARLELCVELGVRTGRLARQGFGYTAVTGGRELRY